MSTNDPDHLTDSVDDTETFHHGKSVSSISAGSNGKPQDGEVEPLVQKEAEDDDANTVEPKKDEEERVVKENQEEV